MARPLTVTLCGGTDGNELTGVHLVHRWEKSPHEISRPGLEVETLLANPRAYAENRRYIDTDLNRCFSLEDLAQAPPDSVETARAKEIDALLGPKQSPRVDFIVDMHTTTSNMGLSICIYGKDPLALRAAAYVHKRCRDVAIFARRHRAKKARF